jgi:hypothetical protein
VAAIDATKMPKRQPAFLYMVFPAAPMVATISAAMIRNASRHLRTKLAMAPGSALMNTLGTLLSANQLL